MKNIIRRAAIALAATAFTAAPAYAGSAQQSLNVSASVVPNCVVSVGALAFGNIDVTANGGYFSSSNLNVTCTNGLDWSASADAGQGAGASFNERRMSGQNGQLTYNLYTDVQRTQIWSENEEGAALTGTGTGESQLVPFYGFIAQGQTGVEVGNYSDTVQVTVSY